MESEGTKVTVPQPGFVIEFEGKLYVALGVLEYDPNHPEITREQEDTIKKLRGSLEKGPRGGAAPIYEGWHMYAGGITRPPPRGPGG